MTNINQNLESLSEDQFSFLKTIQKEYEQGMLLLNSISKSITVYGGSRISRESPLYQDIYDIGKFFGNKGWCVITGGGPGAMTAALQGSRDAGGKTATFRIDLDKSEPRTFMADTDLLCTQFSTRKYLLRQSDVFVVAPGGLGTLDELSELLDLIKTDKYPAKHVFLLNKKFWSNFVNWITDTVSKKYDFIPEKDLKAFTIIDSVEELATHLKL